jgi:tetratricopeptide (TPR) repeat protein
MLTVVSIIIILICLTIILAIAVKKFPALAILDVNNLPGEKEAKFKEQIIKQRVERDLAKIGGSLGRIWLFLNKRLTGFLKDWQARLKKIKFNYHLHKRLPRPERQRLIRRLFMEAEEFLGREEFPAAEEKLIEIISLDQKELTAFFKLGELYRLQKKWLEARQTYGHALKLARQKFGADAEETPVVSPQELYFSLAELEKEAGDLPAALENISEALEIEPNSPRYLDLILDLSIIKKDKAAATAFLARLAAVNPENNKLADWQEKIATL